MSPLAIQAVVVSLSYWTPLMISVPKFELWIPQTAEIGVLVLWIQQELQAIMLQKDFSSLNLILSGLPRIIVDKSQAVACFEAQAESRSALECKTSNFTHQARVLIHINTRTQTLDLVGLVNNKF